MIQPDYSNITLRLERKDDTTRVWDPIRRKWVVLTPEEHVRQYFLAYLLKNMGYPKSLISIEKAIKVGAMTKRFDIVVYNREHVPWLLVECKAPEIPISEQTLHQLLSYHQTVNCDHWVLTNGHQVFCADARDREAIRWVASLPAYEF